jgi:hypothetical protein
MARLALGPAREDRAAQGFDGDDRGAQPRGDRGIAREGQSRDRRRQQQRKTGDGQA